MRRADKYYITISWKTMAWISFIFIGALLFRQGLNQILRVIDRETFGVLLLCAIISAGAIPIVRATSYKARIKVSLVLIAIGIVALALEIPEERAHIALFGVLGFLTGIDNPRQPLFAGLTVGLLVAVMDEILQWYLPYRVGDIRDVLSGVVSALAGALAVKWMDVDGR